MRALHVVLVLLMLATAWQGAEAAQNATFSFPLARGEAVILRINMTGDDWPTVQLRWGGCSDAEGRPAALAQMRIGKMLVDGSATSLVEGEASAVRASVEATVPWYFPQKIEESVSRTLERRCITTQATEFWSGPKVETRVFQTTAESGTITLFVRATPSVLSMDAVKIQGAVYDRSDAESLEAVSLQAHVYELNVQTGAGISVPAQGPHVGWFAPDREGEGVETSIPCYHPEGCADTSCWTSWNLPAGRCTYNAAGIATFRNDSSGTWSLRDSIGAEFHKAAGFVAGRVALPDASYLRMDRTPPVTVALPEDEPVGGAYVTPLVVHLDATDEISGVREIRYRSHPSDAYLTYSSPFVWSTVGTHCIWVSTVDFEDNAEPQRQLCFTTFAP